MCTGALSFSIEWEVVIVCIDLLLRSELFLTYMYYQELVSHLHGREGAFDCVHLRRTCVVEVFECSFPYKDGGCVCANE